MAAGIRTRITIVASVALLAGVVALGHAQPAPVISRSVTVRVDTLPPLVIVEAFSRQFTTRVDTLTAPYVAAEAFGRLVTARVDTLTAAFDWREAFSRQAAVFVDTTAGLPVGKEAFSRTVALRSDTLTAPFAWRANFSRQVGIYRTQINTPLAAACVRDTIRFAWSPTAGFNYYRLYLSTAANASAIFDSVAVGADSFAVYAASLAEGARYYARLGGSQDGGTSIIDLSAFNAGTLIDRTAPVANVPVMALTTPSSDQLVATLTGLDNTAISNYRVKIWRDGGPAVLVRDTVVASNMVLSLNVARGYRYFAEALAVDCAGNASAWSAPSASVYVGQLPNLTAGSVVAPTNAFSEQTVGISWITQNSGSGATLANWTDGIYLSLDSLLSSDDRPIGQIGNLTFLPVGQSYPRSMTVALPRGIQGTYRLLVKADAGRSIQESEETDNVAWSAPINVELAPHSDLVPSLLSTTTDVFNGDTLSVTWRVTNSGQAIAPGGWHDYMFMSSDSTLSGNLNICGTLSMDVGIILATEAHATDLPIGASYDVTRSIVLPRREIGRRYLILATDMLQGGPMECGVHHRTFIIGGVVYEGGGEGNNTRSLGLNILAGPTADLRTESLTGPVALAAGEAVPVTWTVRNVGTAAIHPTEISWADQVSVVQLGSQGQDSTVASAVFTQRVDQLNAAATAPANSNGTSPAVAASVQSLNPGQSYTASGSVTLPTGLVGSARLMVRADAFDAVLEAAVGDTAETNNSRLGPSVPLQPAVLPDLVVANLVAPTTVRIGNQVVVSYSVSNAGARGTRASEWQDEVSLCDTSVFIRERSARVAFIPHLGVLGAGASYQQVKTVPVPTSPVGQGYWFVRSGAATETEVSTVNNLSAPLATAVSFTPSPQFAFTNVQWPAQLISGDSLSLPYVVGNSGAGAASNVQWADGLFLSADSVYQRGVDRPIAVRMGAGPLASGVGYQATLHARIPLSAVGNHFLILVADTASAAMLAGPRAAAPRTFLIQPGAASDLAVVDINIPATIAAGESLKVKWRVVNQGAGSATANRWLVDARCGTAPQMSNFGAALRERGVFTLAPGASYTDSARFQIPSSIGQPIFVTILADPANLTEDGLRTNNSAVLVVQPVPQLPCDILPSNLEYLEPLQSGSGFRLRWTTTNQGTSHAQGRVRDVIRLIPSSGDLLGSMVVGLVDQTIDLAPGATASFTVAFAEDATASAAALNADTLLVTPAITPGSYTIQVQEDATNTLAESNESNNSALSSPSPVGMTVRAFNSSAPDTLFNGHPDFFAVTRPTAEVARVVVTGNAAHTGTLLVSRSGIPTIDNYELRVDGDGGDTLGVVVPTNGEASFMAALYAGAGPLVTQPYTVAIRPVPVLMTGVSPLEIGSESRVTLKVRGTQLDQAQRFELVSAAGEVVVARFFELQADGSVLARWDPTPGALGPAALRMITLGGGTQTLGAPILVAPPVSGMEPTVLAQDGYRVGAASPLEFVVTNNGNVDVPYAVIYGMITPGVDVLNVFMDSRTHNLIDAISTGLNGRGGMSFVPADSTEQKVAHVIIGVAEGLRPGERATITAIVRALGNSTPYTEITVEGRTAAGMADWYGAMAENGRTIGLWTRGIVVSPLLSAAVHDSVAFFTAFSESILVRRGLWHPTDFLARTTSGGEGLRARLYSLARPAAATLAPLPPCGSQGQTPVPENWGCRAFKEAKVGCAPGQRNRNTCGKCDCLTCIERDLVDNKPPQEFPCVIQFVKLRDTFKQRCDDAKANLAITCDVLGLTAATLGVIAVPVTPLTIPAAFVFGLELGCKNAQIFGKCIGENCETIRYETVAPLIELKSCDPNDIAGPAGSGESRWVGAQSTLSYSVRCENDSVFASAAARRITVDVPLAASLDPATLEVSGFGFGSRTVTLPPGTQRWTQRLDERESLGVFVDASVGLDASSNVLRLRLTAIDPTTGLLVADPQRGVLPVNRSDHRGEGWLGFRVRPRSDAPHGEQVALSGAIVFDENTSISTNTWTNRIDRQPPSSSLVAVEVDTTLREVRVRPAGDDMGGAGVADFVTTVTRAGEDPFQTVLGAGDSILILRAVPGQVVTLGLIARDWAGNTEPSKSRADTSFVFGGGGVVVWPGDTDGDGVVNEADVLPIGAYYGSQGAPRITSSMAWVPQVAVPWAAPASTFADATGDGTVDQGDILPIGVNFGETQGRSLSGTRSASAAQDEQLGPLSISFPSGPVSARLVIRGRTTEPVLGLALKINAAGRSIENVGLELPLSSGEVLTFAKVDSSSGYAALAKVLVSSAPTPPPAASGGDAALGIISLDCQESVLPFNADIAIEDVVIRTASGSFHPQGLRLELEGAQPVLPTQIAFLGAVPNPSRGAPVMRFALPTAMTVTLELFDVQGRKSAVGASKKLFAPGVHTLKVSGERLASGVYFARFTAGSFEQTRRVIVLGKP